MNAILTIGAIVAGIVITVVDTPSTQNLSVEPVPTVSNLRVVDGTSTVYEDGSVDLQPAYTVQQTFNPQR